MARPAAKDTADALTGFGATGAAWDAHHQADSRFARGATYDPDPSLARGGDERYDDRYYDVTHDGRITSYEMRFPPHTTVAEARTSVLASEFPRDARVAWFKRLDTCAQMLVRSRTVFRATQGAALVEFSSGEAGDDYNPRDVWSAILLPTEWAGPGSDFGC